MPILCSMILELATIATEDSPTNRKAGWKESYWADGNSISAAQNLFQGVARINSPVSRRIMLLPRTVGVLKACHYQQYDIADGVELVAIGPAKIVQVNAFGSAALLSDVPQMSLQVNFGLKDGHPQRIKHTVAGIPDSQVVDGEGSFSRDMRGRLRSFIDSLDSAFGSVIVNKLAGTSRRIKSIDDAGVITGVQPIAGIAAGSLVDLLRVRGADGLQYGGTYRVTAAAGGTITIQGWEGGDTTGGSLREHFLTFAGFDKAKSNFKRSVIRKVGRPFDQFRGRASNRR